MKPESKAPAYEVRCSNCDVSFAPETRTCVHCGGPTGTPAFFAEPMSEMFSSSPQNDSSYTMISADSGGPDPSTGKNDFEPAASATHEEEESESIGQSIFKSLGGVIWVVMLIGFSLWRSCGSE